MVIRMTSSMAMNMKAVSLDRGSLPKNKNAKGTAARDKTKD